MSDTIPKWAIRASEMINKLQKFVDRYGDCYVYMTDNGYDRYPDEIIMIAGETSEENRFLIS